MFRPSQSELELTAPQGKSADVERLTLGGPYPGLEVTEPLPDGFDWRKQESVDFWVDSEPASWGSSVNIAEVLKGSAEHPDDTYWFQDVGWLNPAEVAAQDGKTFLATCTPDPAKASSLPAAFGARVTDGKLRIWTGSPCAATTGVSLVFKPGQVDQVLTAADAAGVEFQHLTLGEPVPGLAVTKDLPEGLRLAQAAVAATDRPRGHAGSGHECGPRRGAQGFRPAPGRHVLVSGRRLARPGRRGRQGRQDVPRHLHPGTREEVIPPPWPAETSGGWLR